MDFDTSILREADIRGIYPTQITQEFAYRLGLVFGTFVLDNDSNSVVVGHDNRYGGPNLTKKLIEGLISTGVNVIYIGLVTTPMLNYASRKLENEYGIMVTASHNPKEDNGFKLFGKNYQHCNPSELETIYGALKDKNYKFKEGHGNIEYVDIEETYAKFVRKSVNIPENDMKVVVDCGNGTGSVIIRKIYEQLPFETIFLFCDSNPNFPNHHPDPNVKANLKKLKEAVKKNNADLGLAYDGDADRCGFVDDKGNIIDADILMAIMCKNIIKENENKTILIDVKCSKTLEDEIRKYGGKVLIETPSSAKQERVMDELGIKFGGGYSNHIFFKDRHPGYDDGIYVGLRVQELLLKENKSLSELNKGLKHYYNTEEIKVSTTDEKKFKIVRGIKEYCDSKNYRYSTIDGVKIFKDNSWALLRASNTGPNLTLRFEANSRLGLNSIQKEFMNVLKKLQK